MHIQKSSAYPTAVGALPRNRAPGADRQSLRSEPIVSIRNAHDSGDQSTPVLHYELSFAPLDHSNKIRVERGNLFELHPKLDYRSQTAIEAYEALQYQSVAEERESISRLLGVDLYV
jgi:hypothetical protein